MYDFATHAHTYQKNAAAHLWNSAAHGGVAALWLDPGYGKTTVVLHAFKALRDAGIVRNMVVVAPLRVAQTVWAQEIEEWASLKGLVACRLHGPKKERVLERRNVDIWIINYEGIPWFIKQCKNGKIPYVDVLVFDEIRRMKNAQGSRFKAARPLAAMAKFKWGLTGTPASNGLTDLFGQFLILDDGLALGKYITKYRMNYFEKGFDGFTWLPRPGAQDMIEARIQHYIYRADGFLDLPEFVNDVRKVTLPPGAKKEYSELKKQMILELEERGEKITAANAAVLVGKLKQIANGRVYDENRKIIEIHSEKKAALEELIEELGDEQLLIAYEYNHDLDQLKELLGDDLPYLGAGVNERTAMSHVERWNAREIRILAAHPASAGHGLNLQKGNAHHVLWWGPTIDLDHYIQFNRRLLRQGNKASHVVVHTFVAVGTVDESVIVAREVKDGLQSGLLSALTAEFGDANVADEETQTEDHDMTELAFKSDANQTNNSFGGQQQPQQNFQQPPQQPQAPQQVNNPFGVRQQPQNFQQPQQPQNFQQPQQPQNFQQQPQQNFQQPQAPATGNPFGNANAGQQEAIRNDVAAAPVPQPDPASAPQNPLGGGQTAPIEDAQVTHYTPGPAAPAQSEEVKPAVVAQHNGMTNIMADAPVARVPTTAPAGMVPLYTFVPADKLDKVLSAIGRAVK